MKKENISKKDVLPKIMPVIENILVTLHLIPVEVDFVKESGRWFLRIYIYNDKEPITHKECEAVTKALDDYLDELIPVHYYLEVSSPGISRKLKSPREYAIFKGKKVKVKLKQTIEGINDKVFSAKILEYNPQQGLKVKAINENKEIILEENNISAIHLDLI